MQRIWTELRASSDFDARRRAVDEFNARSRWRKKGLAMIPTKFGISFTTKFLNQVLPCLLRQESCCRIICKATIFMELNQFLWDNDNIRFTKEWSESSPLCSTACVARIASLHNVVWRTLHALPPPVWSLRVSGRAVPDPARLAHPLPA